MISRHCPCGYETRAGFRTGNPDPLPEEPTITVEVQNTASETETARWRSQLERKFEPPREKFPDLEEAQRLVDNIFRPDIPGLREAETGDIDSGPDERFEAAPGDIENGSYASESRGGAPDLSFPRRPAQQALSLEPLLAAEVTKSRVRPERDAERAVSKEILFSRVLSGILDLLLPAGTAVLFVFAACWFLSIDFFSPSATYWWLLLALFFYFFNSLYFFWTAGRTPGMSATDLHLSGEDTEEPPFVSVVIRILLFLPVAASVVGLILALFDSQCRALHDRLSRTKVVGG